MVCRAFQILGVLVLVSVVLFGCGETVPNQPGMVSLQWSPPVLNTDGTPIGDSLAGYRIYFGRQSGVYTKVITINDPRTTNTAIYNIASGTYYFTITVFNSYGNESDFSNQVTKDTVDVE